MLKHPCWLWVSAATGPQSSNKTKAWAYVQEVWLEDQRKNHCRGLLTERKINGPCLQADFKFTRGISVSSSSVFEDVNCVQAEWGDLKLWSYCGNRRKMWDFLIKVHQQEILFTLFVMVLIVNLGKLFNVWEVDFRGSYWTSVGFWYLIYYKFLWCVS